MNTTRKILSICLTNEEKKELKCGDVSHQDLSDAVEDAAVDLAHEFIGNDKRFTTVVNAIFGAFEDKDANEICSSLYALIRCEAKYSYAKYEEHETQGGDN